ncbi:translation repressor RelE [Pseudomonas sp. 250J]|uniref:Type II toxin-antitoxin system RelE/ParE family toxin n=1 Tax=Pseudomonas peradeniyensis TaxID=2745488 RepID=A0ABT2V4N6_9PSED|nr:MULTISPECIES: type II toxin-antitoxin system RelE/ParE family toxin [Pseudomonas]KNX80623.1 translation repressor RelE [Pseudomonas sp. 250J]MCU7236664.1 type II toxin-antitoxin system RelE/ParE family toxin [Pseudomonas peradeniyensis]MCU7278458.1 type II toxin-antitoxin system RelE/ParE family toxin [Pseudomonas peradeniyensis]QZA54690.1 type II toxin-antitoxin system RelE/ParE family toxin [Pseudomonas sp. 2hn]
MRLVWSAMARNDRLRIMTVVAQDNPAAAEALDEAFRDKARRAARNPRLYKPGRCVETHEIVVTPNYVMIYQVQEDEVEILRILHARQQWP